MSDNSQKNAIALGTWAWGDSGTAGDGYFGSTLTAHELREVAKRAHAHGFTLWDTAPVYGMGRSESTLAKALESLDRSSYQLSTKFTPQIAGDSATPVADMLERSLERLGTDYIDLYWIHNPADIAKWTPGLIPLLESGKVRSVGVSNHNIDEIQLTNKILGEAGFRVDAVQNHYSLLYRSSEKAGVLNYCRDNDIDFYAYMVLEQGALTGRYTPENPLPESSNRANIYNPVLSAVQPLTDRLASIGASRDASASDVAIAWTLAKGVTPIVGVTKAHYIDGLVRAQRLELAEREINEIEALAKAAQINTRGAWEHEM